jgi:hypothetical protein
MKEAVQSPKKVKIMVKTRYNRTNRIRDNAELALRAIGEPASWPTISNWLFDNVRRWHKHAPTSGAIGAILATDHRFVKIGQTDINYGDTIDRIIGHQRRGRYTLWALKEWE